MIGLKKLVETDDEAINLSVCFAKVVVVGDTLCQKCSSAARFAQSKQRKLEQIQNVTNVPQTDSQVSTSSSEPSSQLSPNDAGYCPQLWEDVEKETIELPLRRIVSTHKYCFLCKNRSGIIVVPFEARQQVFTKKGIFIPEGNRCCQKHLIKKKFYTDELNDLTVVSHSSIAIAEDITKLFRALGMSSDRELHDRIGDFSIPEERIRTFTGLNWEQIIELREMMVSLRNRENRTVTQALIVFLFRLRTGNSNEMICSILGLDRHQQVSDFSKSILKSFDKDLLPTRFGLKAVKRDDLINNHSTNLLQKLHNVSDDNLALIADATYLKHQKSSNNELDCPYSGQKRLPLCKPFTICTTNGYIVDVLGPFYAKENDATILEKNLTANDSNLKKLMSKKNDVFILDRGFRDVKSKLEEDNFRVLMPAMKNKNEKQLSTADANNSRLVTIRRWVIEAVHGSVAQKYKFFHQQLDNRYLPEAGLYCRIVCFLINQFGKKLISRITADDDIIQYIISKNSEETLFEEVTSGRYSRRKSLFQNMTSTDIQDFPEMTEQDLVKLFTGTYQLKQAISYLAELMGEADNMDVGYCKVSPDLIKLQVRSRHIERKKYTCYIHYKPDTNGSVSICRYYCECSNGMRTVGCCSHVAAIIYFLAYGRYQSSIVKPAAHLTKIYEQDHIVPVIEEDSDED